MTTLFYLFGFFMMFHELSWIFSPIERTKDLEKFDTPAKQNKGREWKDLTPDYKSKIKTKGWQLFLAAWLLVGLISIQWVSFGLFLIFQLVFIAPVSKLTQYSKIYTILHWLNSVIGFVFVLFVIINHFHLHIDVLSLIKNYVHF